MYDEGSFESARPSNGCENGGHESSNRGRAAPFEPTDFLTEQLTRLANGIHRLDGEVRRAVRGRAPRYVFVPREGEPLELGSSVDDAAIAIETLARLRKASSEYS
jgi:hypothetical protein